MTHLSPESQALLRSDDNADGPSVEARARMRGRILAQVAAMGVVTSGVAASKAATAAAAGGTGAAAGSTGATAGAAAVAATSAAAGGATVGAAGVVGAGLTGGGVLGGGAALSVFGVSMGKVALGIVAAGALGVGAWSISATSPERGLTVAQNAAVADSDSVADGPNAAGVAGAKHHGGVVGSPRRQPAVQAITTAVATATDGRAEGGVDRTGAAANERQALGGGAPLGTVSPFANSSGPASDDGAPVAAGVGAEPDANHGDVPPLSASAGTLDQQAELLMRARRAVRAGQYGSALQLLDDYRSRYGDGALAEERAALQVIALCHQERGSSGVATINVSGRAHAAAERFRARYAASPLRRHVDRACGR